MTQQILWIKIPASTSVEQVEQISEKLKEAFAGTGWRFVLAPSLETISKTELVKILEEIIQELRR